MTNIERWNLVSVINTVAQDHGIITADLKMREADDGAWCEYDQVELELKRLRSWREKDIACIKTLQDKVERLTADNELLKQQANIDKDFIKQYRAENERLQEDIDYNWTNEVDELRHELREERAKNERLKTIIRRTHDNLPTSPEIAYQRLRDAIESFADTAQEGDG